MENAKIKTFQLTKAKETLFIPLLRRAKDSQSKRSVLHDTRALEIINAVDYDFSKIKGGSANHTVIRAKQLDEWAKEFIASHPDAVVVYLGCGLDTRVTRINPPATIDWYDVDFPDVIAVKKNFYSDNAHYKMIASSITDEAWLTQIPDNRPALIIADGVMEYLTAEDVKNLLQRLTDHFPKGQMIFDVMGSSAVKIIAKRYGIHTWGVDDTSEIERWNPKLKKLDEIPLFQSQYMRLLPVTSRIVYRLMAVSSKLRSFKALRYEF